MDYTELVKRLRERSVFLFPHHGESRSYDADIMHEAADAIEWLQNELEYTSRQYELALEDLEKAEQPKWIPVTERLPGREWVLCKCLANIHEILSLRDGYWYHDPQHKYMFDFVTHWMPLPEPPKEETT